ncbi:AraC family transcriptional regulator N-terminal domain-containing protein [Sphingomonas sp. NFX23]|uniref:AraC family transcriptional regulator N-terminal domain-containing protein n=1 Tax=Sphingomonas sp. NFX23 TaxID=2819532 RepID=UPI003CEB38C7
MVPGRVSSSVQYSGTARSRVPTTHYETKTPPGPSITELLDAWLRLLRLLDAPQDITVLAPLCEHGSLTAYFRARRERSSARSRVRIAAFRRSPRD